MYQYVKPQCCEAAKTYPSIYFSRNEGVDGVFRPCWKVSLPKDNVWWEMGWDMISKFPPAKFCPFCGMQLPKMRLKSPLPENICKPNDGYCGNCKSRLMGCDCPPVETAYEIDPD